MNKSYRCRLPCQPGGAENHLARVNRLLMGATSDPRARVQVAMFTSAIAGAVIHPLVLDLDDESLRSQLLKQARSLLAPR